MAAPVKHHPLGASGAHRWVNCPGSVKVGGLYPAGTTVYAEEGTLAHSVAEHLIRSGGMSRQYTTKVHDFYMDHPELGNKATGDQMIRLLEEYADFVQECYADQLKEDKAAQLMTEQMVDLDPWIPGGFGTSDVVIIRSGYLHIIDLKYGKGVPVSADDNPQLRLYALGSLYDLDPVYEIQTVQMTIYQPRLDNISTDTISAKDLYEWGDQVIKPAAKLAMTDDAPFAAGDWCMFCPARRDCRERAEHYLELEDYKNKALLKPAEIAVILKDVAGLVKWAEDLKEGALARALEGEKLPGWKVVEGRSVRKYSGTEEEIVRQCEGAGYDRAMLYEHKLLGITGMEALMGKKQFNEVLGGYVEKPQGKPTLAPESDKRPAITGNSAVEDFADE